MLQSVHMKIAIIGGGLTGLTAAYELAKRGQTVVVFEKDEKLGGLANGFSAGSWDWKLEKTYHHIFTNDHDIITLAKELGIANSLMILSPTTSVYWQGKQHPFDTPLNILRYPGLPFIDRIRTGATAAIMKLDPFWKPLEGTTAKSFFKKINGDVAWERIWEPLLDAKFGPYADKVAASWLWARLKKRTPRLGYFAGGFETVVTALAHGIKQYGGTVKTNVSIPAVKKSGSAYVICQQKFDAVLLTTPSSVATRLMAFPKSYEEHLHSIPHLYAQTLILETTEPVFEKTYWLNINDRHFPFLAVVEHTNLIDKAHYDGHHILYIGNYLPDDHPYLGKTKEELLALFLPYIKKIAPHWKKQTIVNTFLFTAPFAQPVHTLHYSLRAPKLKTPIPHVYVVNLDSIYPWDRGTNYAVATGRSAAQKILQEENAL